jgi:formylglycine-generating enzyme required for sulfatase activity
MFRRLDADMKTALALTFTALGLATGVSAAQPQQRDLRLEPINPAAQRAFEKQVKVALVVGISAYPQGSGLSSLKYAARDAEVLGATLKSQGYLVRQLTESDATRAMIRRTLRELSDAVLPNEGTILFFFGGHGFNYKGTNYLATFGVTADDLDGEGLPVKDVEELLLATKAKRKLLFVDACRNDPVQAARSTGQRSFEKLQAAEGIRVLFSTKQGHVSFEDEALRQGVFTYFLAKGLQGEAAGADGLVTFRDLADYVTDRMRAYTLERGQLQIPFEAGESSGDFLLSTGSKSVRLPPGTPMPVAPSEPEKTPPLPFAPPEPVRPVLQAGTTKMNPKDGLTYLWIPPGTFQMGCSPGDSECFANEKPEHTVTISKGFWIGQTEVTQEAYERVMGNNPSHFKGPKLPVESIDWNQAQNYCTAAGMRLPTEAEWEYAARAGSSGSRYGDLDAIGWYLANSGGKTHEVGQKKANAWGLLDTIGNVWEWVADWHAWGYQAGSATDPHGPASGTDRARRGGSWNGDAQLARASIRTIGPPAVPYVLGVRCAGNAIEPAHSVRVGIP